jgi:hypothetical protein
MKKFRAKTRVIADLCSLEMRTMTTAKMASKSTKRGGINVRQSAASPLQKATEMSCGTNISDGTARGVSVAFEIIRKRVDA